MSTNSSHQKRLQVAVDQKLSDNVNNILSDLGLTPSTVINALYRRIEAEGKVPFELALTDEERANLHLMSTIKSSNIPVIKNQDKAEKFLFSEDEKTGTEHHRD